MFLLSGAVVVFPFADCSVSWNSLSDETFVVCWQQKNFVSFNLTCSSEMMYCCTEVDVVDWKDVETKGMLDGGKRNFTEMEFSAQQRRLLNMNLARLSHKLFIMNSELQQVMRT